jgi:acyl carrier protein
MEQQLADIVATLLGVTRVGVHDNFFLLGGHSLLGTQLIGQISQRFGVSLSLYSLFSGPTVAQIATKVEQLIREHIETLSEEEVSRLLSQQATQP